MDKYPTIPQRKQPTIRTEPIIQNNLSSKTISHEKSDQSPIRYEETSSRINFITSNYKRKISQLETEIIKIKA